MSAPTTTPVEQFSAQWKLGGWSIGQSGHRKTWTAWVHGPFRACAHGVGSTPEKAFAEAVEIYNRENPDVETTKRRRLESARAELAALEAEMGGEA